MRSCSSSVAWSRSGRKSPSPVATWFAAAAFGIGFALLSPPGASAAPCTSIAGGPICIDGQLQEWSVQVKDSPGATPLSVWGTAAVGGNRGFAWTSEDTSDNAGHSFYVSPNYGGQDYDFEFLGAAAVGDRLAISIASGIRPDNGAAYFAPGDILILVPTKANPSVKRMYAIEVGGGVPGALGGGPLTTGGPGADYGLTASGNTASYSLSSSSGNMLTAQTAGSVWLTTPDNWFYDPFYNCGENPNDGPGICGKEPVQFRSKLGTAPTLLDANAEYLYTLNDTLQYDGAASQKHSVIEAALDLAAIAPDYAASDPLTIEIFWGPSCGNDRLMVALDVQPITTFTETVPGPGGLALFGLGLAFAGLRSRRRRG